MSLANQIEKEIGPEPKQARGSGAGGPPRRDTLFGKANSVDTKRVLDWLYIEHDDKFSKCPGCGEEGALLCENGGLKCLHDRCKRAGVPGKDGFRTNVDIAEAVRSGTAAENARAICQQFGIQIQPHEKETSWTGAEDPDPDYTPEPYQREPGEDDEPREPAKAKAATEARVLTVRELIEQSGLRALTRERVETCTTGNYRIDDTTGGFKGGFVWLMAADTSWGKSSWLISIADENIKRGKRVLIVSAEDDEALYGDRLLVRRARVDYKRFRRGRRHLSRDDQSKITAVMAKAEDVPVFLDGRGRSIEVISRQIVKLIREEGIDLVALDYVQALDNEKQQQDRRNQLTYIGRRFTDAVKSEGKAGLVLSQVTLDPKNPKKIPDKSAVRDCRDLVNAADVVIMGCEPDKPIMSGGRQVADVGQKCMLLEKVKDGPRGGIYPMQWDPLSACFDVVVDPEAERLDKAIGDFSQFDDPRFP